MRTFGQVLGLSASLSLSACDRADPSDTVSRDDEMLLASEEPVPRTTKAPPPDLVSPARAPARIPPARSRPLLAGAASGPAAYVTLDGNHIVRLDEAGWQTIWSAPFIDLSLGGDDQIYLHDQAGVHRLVGEQFETVLAFDDGGGPTAFAGYDRVRIGPKGELWLLDVDRDWAARVEAGKLKVWDEPEHSGLEVAWASSMAIDGRGQAWFVLEPELGILHVRDGPDWARVQGWALAPASAPAPTSFRGWAGARAGGLWLLTERELLLLDDGGVSRRWSVAATQLALSRAGTPFVHGAGCRIQRLEAGVLQDLTEAGEDCPAMRLLAGDDQGRAWLDDGGLFVVADGGTRLSLSLPQSGRKLGLLVVGRGPTVLAQGSP